MAERKLASIRKISNILPIDKADRICRYIIDGWQIVDGIGKYQIGDLVCMLEIDSFVPHALAPFLTKDGHHPKVYKGVEGQRLRSMKLKGELSQGLILPVLLEEAQFAGGCLNYINDLCISVGFENIPKEGADVTELLGILKWEKEIPACLAGTMRGNFPTAVRKTDQERIQNLTKRFDKLKALTYEVTEKLDGSSCTFFMDAEGVFHVCSRNVDLIESEDNYFWKVARKYDIEGKMRNEACLNLALQGEMVGAGIQGNQYETDLEFFLFDIFDAEAQEYMSPIRRKYFLECLNFNQEGPGINHVPVIASAFKFEEDATIADVLKWAGSDTSRLNGSVREGLVFKSTEEPVVSFKVINNSWLEIYE